jgi:hypothetical protein
MPILEIVWPDMPTCGIPEQHAFSDQMAAQILLLRFKETLLTKQAKLPDSPFEVTDTSGREHLIDGWAAEVRHRIDNADVVVVLCGEHAFLAKGVAEELSICA